MTDFQRACALAAVLPVAGVLAGGGVGAVDSTLNPGLTTPRVALHVAGAACIGCGVGAAVGCLGVALNGPYKPAPPPPAGKPPADNYLE